MNLVVVGVDQSEGAKAALAFAHEEARLRNATLRAVHAWQFGYIGYTGFEGAVPALGGDIAELRAAAVAAPTRGGWRSSSGSSKGLPAPSSSTSRPEPICSSWAPAGTGASPNCCSAPSASSEIGRAHV